MSGQHWIQATISANDLIKPLNLSLNRFVKTHNKRLTDSKDHLYVFSLLSAAGVMILRLHYYV